MGSIRCSRVIVLVLCFLVVSGLIYGGKEYRAVKKPVPLAHALANLPGWKNGGTVPLDAKILDSLELDDYFYQHFTNGKDGVSLYVGYYLCSKKVGAAHSPLVCFPGQGWLLQRAEQRSVQVGDEKINLMRVEASTPQRKELLIFWFQTFEDTSSSEFFQKLYTLKSKILNGREDNAFVRITVPMDKISPDAAYAIGVGFLRAFYPRFLNQIQSGIS
jgi:EpsI family protein